MGEYVFLEDSSVLSPRVQLTRTLCVYECCVCVNIALFGLILQLYSTSYIIYKLQSWKTVRYLLV